MTPFEILSDAIVLQKAGRANAAKAQWAKLSPDFQMKVLAYVTNAFEFKDTILGENTEVLLNSPKFGKLTLTDQLVADWKTFIPQLVS